MEAERRLVRTVQQSQTVEGAAQTETGPRGPKQPAQVCTSSRTGCGAENQNHGLQPGPHVSAGWFGPEAAALLRDTNGTLSRLRFAKAEVCVPPCRRLWRCGAQTSSLSPGRGWSAWLCRRRRGGCRRCSAERGRNSSAGPEDQGGCRSLQVRTGKHQEGGA